MKRGIPLLLLISTSLLAQGPDFEGYRPTEEQEWKLAENTAEMGRIEENIAKLYGKLKILGHISESGESLISMRTSHLNQFEQHDSILSEEIVHIVWKNGAPAQFTFRVRTANVRGLRTIVTIFQVGSVREGNEMREPDIHLIVRESLPSGHGNLEYYIMTPWNAPVITEQTRTHKDSGVTNTYPLTQIRDPHKKIEVMNRLLDSYRYLERYLDYLVRRSIRKELNDMNRYLPRS